MVAIILMTFLIINWPNFVNSLVYPGFYSPLNFYKASRFAPTLDGRPWQTQRTKLT